MSDHTPSGFPVLIGRPLIALDTETTGLDWAGEDNLFGIALSTGDEEFYWDVRITPQVIHWLDDQLVDFRGTLVFHNAAFDWHFLRKAGIRVPLGRVEDTCVRACLIDEHLPNYKLDFLANRYLGCRKEDIIPELAALFGGLKTHNVQMPRLCRAPVELVSGYAKTDVRLTHSLFRYQESEIANQGLERICSFERSLMPHFILNEARGVRVNVTAAERARDEVDIEISALDRRLAQEAGRSINVDARADMLELFRPTEDATSGIWTARDGTPLERTDKGAASVNKEALSAMTDPIAALVLEIRRLRKVRSTFLTNHILESHINGRVYPSINQTKGENGGTGTGRLSYQGPALQQISKRDKRLAMIVRSLFEPDEGHSWHCRDWSQSDFRWFANYVNTPVLNRAYREGNPDFHRITAEIANIPRDPPASGGANAKQINLGLIFGMGEGKMAKTMLLPWQTVEKVDMRTGKPYLFMAAGPEAKAIFTKYHEAIPGVKKFMRSAENRAKARGYVISIEGRHLRYPRGFGAHKAAGHLFQSATADMLKRKYLEVCQLFEAEGRGSVILTVHDELDLNIPHGDTGLIAQVREIMHAVKNSRIPFRTTGGTGENWYAAMTNEEPEYA